MSGSVWGRLSDGAFYHDAILNGKIVMPRKSVVNTYAEWTAFSATRSGAPVKSRAVVYPLIRRPDYEFLFVGSAITSEEFSSWHKHSTEDIEKNSELPIGWAAKLINVYLKTRVYVAREGRVNLYSFIHPPVDNGLWDGIEEYCSVNNQMEILAKITSVRKIKDIDTYEKYIQIIDGCKQLASHLKCELLEVEQLWQGTSFDELG